MSSPAAAGTAFATVATAAASISRRRTFPGTTPRSTGFAANWVSWGPLGAAAAGTPRGEDQQHAGERQRRGAGGPAGGRAGGAVEAHGGGHAGRGAPAREGGAVCTPALDGGRAGCSVVQRLGADVVAVAVGVAGIADQPRRALAHGARLTRRDARAAGAFGRARRFLADPVDALERLGAGATRCHERRREGSAVGDAAQVAGHVQH